jgi:hypothetical protein
MGKVNKSDYEKHLEAKKNNGLGYFKAIVRVLLEEQRKADIGLDSPPFVYAPIGVFQSFSHFLNLGGVFEPHANSQTVLAINKFSFLSCQKPLPDLLELLVCFVNHHHYLQTKCGKVALNYPVFAFCQSDLWLVAVVDSLDGPDDECKIHLLREYIISHVLSGTGIEMGSRIVKIESEKIQVKKYRLMITYLDKWDESALQGRQFCTFGGDYRPYEDNINRVKKFFAKVKKVDEILNASQFQTVEYEIREKLWHLGYVIVGQKQWQILKNMNLSGVNF